MGVKMDKELKKMLDEMRKNWKWKWSDFQPKGKEEKPEGK